MKWIEKKTKKKFQEDDTILDKLAKVRGIDDIDTWLHPISKVVHDPYALERIDEAVQRIVKAIHLGEKIVVVADIDADGVFSCAIMNNYLRQFTENVSYIHAQRSKGHGIETIEDKIPEGTTLLVVVDSSSNSVESAKRITERGIDVVVIDHHEIDVENPYITLVNCQAGDYPNKHLSGSAMTYKVCQVLDDYLGSDIAEDFIDLCAMGLISDMMNMKNPENRYLVFNGLKNIQNEGIKKLLALGGVKELDSLNTTTISFKVAPVINASTRFDKIEMAIDLLTLEDDKEVTKLAKDMVKMNEDRKAQEMEVVKKALDKVDNRHKVAILIDNEIGSGFRGLIAMQIVSKLQKPTLVLYHDEENRVYYGSGRSIGDIKLKSLLSKTRNFYFVQGHEGAFGLKIHETQLEEAMQKVDKMLEKENFELSVEYDLEVNVNEVTEFDIKQVEQFSKICGMGFPEPRFKLTGIVALERAVMGKNEDTIKISCEDNFALMKFRTDSNYAEDVDVSLEEDFITEMEAIGTLNLNVFFNWKKRENIVTNQLFLEDYKIL